MDSTSTIIVALVGALSALAVAYLGHRRSKVVDANAVQSGIVSNHRAGTEQVIKGLNDLIDQYQESNTSIRADIRELEITYRTEVKQLRDRLDMVTADRDSLRLEVARLKKRLPRSDADTPNPPNK